MQSQAPSDSFHQFFDGRDELKALYPLCQQPVWRSECANNGSSSSNHQSWKVRCGSNYFANELATSNPNEDANQLACSSAELSSSFIDTTSYRSPILTTLIGGSQTKSRFQPAYPQCLPTESQSTYFQDQSMWSDAACIQTPLEFGPSQRGPMCWYQKAQATVKNFPSSPSPTSTGVQPGTPSSLASWATPPLLNHKSWSVSEQLPGQSDNGVVFVARPTENYWNNCPCAKYPQAPGSFTRPANQQASNVGYCNSGPFHNTSTKACKGSTDGHMFGLSQQGDRMQALRRDSISTLQSSTGNHLMNHGREAMLSHTPSTMSSGDGLCTQIPSQNCSKATSDPPVAPQFNSFSHRTSENHQIDCESTSRAHNLSNVYSQKKSQRSRKRRSYDVLRFLEELTFGELKALLFAFEVMDKRKRTAQANLRASEVNVSPQQNPAMVQSCQFAAQNINSASHVNSKNLSSASSLRDQLMSNRNIDSNSFFPKQSEQQILSPCVPNHHQCNSLIERTSLSLQSHEEKSSVCQDSTMYPHIHQGALGVECNMQDYSLNCLNSKNPEPLGSGSVDPNYFGSNQQDEPYNHSFRSLDISSTSDMNRTSPQINASQRDEQRRKEIKALYDMLRTSFGNKMNGYSKRQKLEGPSHHVQPVSSESGQINITSNSVMQSAYVNQSSQRADCQDIWDTSTDLVPNLQNPAGAQQFMHDASSPLVKWNASSPSACLHSRVQLSQSAEASPSLHTFGNEKAAVLLTQSEVKTEGPFISPLHTTSTVQEKPASFPSATRSLTTKPADMLNSLSCSSQGSGSQQTADKVCATSSPHCARADRTIESYLINEHTATSKSFQENLTLALRAEEFSRMQEAAAHVGVHLSNAISNDQKGDVYVPPSEGFPEQLIAQPIESSKLSSAPSKLVDLHQHQAGLQCKASSEVPAGIHTENGSPFSDIYTTNGNKVSDASPEKVVEELNSIPNSQSVSTKESDTLEFILRSLGIIPEDNEGPSVATLTSLSPGVTSPEQNIVLSLSNDPSGPEVKQMQDLTLPSFNTAISNDKEQVFASVGPGSTGSKETRGWSDVPFNPGERQQTAKVPFEDDKTTPALVKQKPADVNRSMSVFQANCQVRSVQSPLVNRAQSEEENRLQETEPPNVVHYSVGGSVPVNSGDNQEVEENLANNLTCAPTAHHPHAHVVTNAIKLEGGVESSKGNNPLMNLHTLSKLNQSVSSVLHASALLDEPPLIAHVEEMQETLSLPSVGGDDQLLRLLSSPSSSPCELSACSTPLIKPVADACCVGLVENSRRALRSDTDSSSPRKVPEEPAHLSTSASNRSVTRNKHHVADGPFDLCRGLRKQQDMKSGISGTMENSISMVCSCQENRKPGSEENSEKPGVFPRAANVKSSAGTENSSAPVSSSVDTCGSLSVIRGVLASRITLKCRRPALAIKAFPQSSNGEVKTVGQTSLAGGSLLRAKGCRSAAISKGAGTDLLSGIRISFVFSLSEYQEHWKVINGAHLISNSLVTAGRQLKRSFLKVSNFSTMQIGQDPTEMNGPIGAGIGAGSNLGRQGNLITDSPHSQSIVPFLSDSFVQLANTNIFSAVAKHSDCVYQFEVKLNQNLESFQHWGKPNAMVCADLSKLLTGSGCCTESPREANDTAGRQRATSVLCCFNSKDLITQDLFSKNEFRSMADLETTTESIVRFWCPSGQGSEQHQQEIRKGFDFKSSVEWLHSGIDQYTVVSAAESNSSVHASNAHYLQFGLTATVDREQLYREKSQPRELSSWCSATGSVAFEEPEQLESVLRSQLLTDQDSNGSWDDIASHNTSLETYRPDASLQNSSSQITRQYGDKEFEANNVEITVPSVRMDSIRNRHTNSNDRSEVQNQDTPYPEDSTQPFNGPESWSKFEPGVDDSSKIKIKRVDHQGLKTVLSELPSATSTALTHSPASKLVDETSEVTSPGPYWKISQDCGSSHLDVAHEQMEISATDCSSDSAQSELSLGRVGSTLQH
ncbi:uncharacterized protein LOC125485393 [Rhincodon typus]|uniref:uncharacterized protein LOC125485393 n=1 Tax=Rhincodon typus TaxID=259920 RepID=UPI00202F0540|nr:uncharacterized protein LOC125485393 [Rhincodon typus]XP_048463928.1 uncharacterized protein LOC125485393 [Rhincodon typus]